MSHTIIRFDNFDPNHILNEWSSEPQSSSDDEYKVDPNMYRFYQPAPLFRRSNKALNAHHPHFLTHGHNNQHVQHNHDVDNTLLPFKHQLTPYQSNTSPVSFNTNPSTHQHPQYRETDSQRQGPPLYQLHLPNSQSQQHILRDDHHSPHNHHENGQSYPQLTNPLFTPTLSSSERHTSDPCDSTLIYSSRDDRFQVEDGDIDQPEREIAQNIADSSLNSPKTHSQSFHTPLKAKISRGDDNIPNGRDGENSTLRKPSTSPTNRSKAPSTAYFDRTAESKAKKEAQLLNQTNKRNAVTPAKHIESRISRSTHYDTTSSSQCTNITDPFWKQDTSVGKSRHSKHRSCQNSSTHLPNSSCSSSSSSSSSLAHTDHQNTSQESVSNQEANPTDRNNSNKTLPQTQPLSSQNDPPGLELDAISPNGVHIDGNSEQQNPSPLNSLHNPINQLSPPASQPHNSFNDPNRLWIAQLNESSRNSNSIQQFSLIETSTTSHERTDKCHEKSQHRIQNLEQFDPQHQHQHQDETQVEVSPNQPLNSSKPSKSDSYTQAELHSVAQKMLATRRSKAFTTNAKLKLSSRYKLMRSNKRVQPQHHTDNHNNNQDSADLDFDTNSVQRHENDQDGMSQQFSPSHLQHHSPHHQHLQQSHPSDDSVQLHATHTLQQSQSKSSQSHASHLSQHPSQLSQQHQCQQLHTEFSPHPSSRNSHTISRVPSQTSSTHTLDQHHPATLPSGAQTDIAGLSTNITPNLPHFPANSNSSAQFTQSPQYSHKSEFSTHNPSHSHSHSQSLLEPHDRDRELLVQTQLIFPHLSHTSNLSLPLFPPPISPDPNIAPSLPASFTPSSSTTRVSTHQPPSINSIQQQQQQQQQQQHNNDKFLPNNSPQQHRSLGSFHSATQNALRNSQSSSRFDQYSNKLDPNDPTTPHPQNQDNNEDEDDNLDDEVDSHDIYQPQVKLDEIFIPTSHFDELSRFPLHHAIFTNNTRLAIQLIANAFHTDLQYIREQQAKELQQPNGIFRAHHSDLIVNNLHLNSSHKSNSNVNIGGGFLVGSSHPQNPLEATSSNSSHPRDNNNTTDPIDTIDTGSSLHHITSNNHSLPNLPLPTDPSPRHKPQHIAATASPIGALTNSPLRISQLTPQISHLNHEPQTLLVVNVDDSSSTTHSISSFRPNKHDSTPHLNSPSLNPIPSLSALTFSQLDLSWIPHDFPNLPPASLASVFLHPNFLTFPYKLQLSTTINATTSVNISPLHIATVRHNMLLFDIFLSTGCCDITISTHYNRDALAMAVRLELVDCVEKLLNLSRRKMLKYSIKPISPVPAPLQRGGTLNSNHASTPLAFSSTTSPRSTPQQLVPTPNEQFCKQDDIFPSSKSKVFANGSNQDVYNSLNVNQSDIDKYPPIYWAVVQHRSDIVQLLISSGADVNFVGETLSTLLHHAVCSSVLNGDEDDDDDDDDDDGRDTPDVASKLARNKRKTTNKRDIELVDDPDTCLLLLSAQCPIDRVDADGRTPLYLAVMNGLKDAVHTILDFNPTVALMDGHEVPLIHRACLASHYSVVQRLLESQIDVNFQHFSIDTPIFWACERKSGSLAIVKILLRWGAVFDTPSPVDGLIPAERALQCGNSKTAHYLTKKLAQLRQ